MLLLPKHRPEAILNKPAQGNIFADVLGHIHSKINPNDIDAKVQAQEVADRCEAPGTTRKAKFGDALRATLVEPATVRCRNKGNGQADHR